MLPSSRKGRVNELPRVQKSANPGFQTPLSDV